MSGKVREFDHDWRVATLDKDKDLMSKDKDEDLKIGPRGQQHCKHRVSNKRPGLLEIQSCQEYQPYTSYTIATPALTPAQSADTDSLLSPQKFLRT